MWSASTEDIQGFDRLLRVRSNREEEHQVKVCRRCLFRVVPVVCLIFFFFFLRSPFTVHCFLKRLISKNKEVKVKLLGLILARGIRVCPVYPFAQSCTGKKIIGLKINLLYLLYDLKTLMAQLDRCGEEERRKRISLIGEIHFLVQVNCHFYVVVRSRNMPSYQSEMKD